MTNPSVQEWINGNSHMPTTELVQKGVFVFIKILHRWLYLGTNPTAPKQAVVIRKEASPSKGMTTEHNAPAENPSLKTLSTPSTKRDIFPPKKTFQEVFIMSLFFLTLTGTSHWNYQIWARFFSSEGFPALYHFSPVKYLNILTTLRFKWTINSAI